MTTKDLIDLLLEFYREKLAVRDRHVAGAEAVANYDFNNAYQNIIGRDDTQLSWVRVALEELDVAVPQSAAVIELPDKGKGKGAQQSIVADDSRRTQTFVDRWRPRVATMTNARHRRMLEVILGESLEQKHFFDDMLQGRDDLLGRRPPSFSTGGGVMPTRWVE